MMRAWFSRSPDPLPPPVPWDPSADTSDQIMARVRARWNLDAPVPVPIGSWLRCPVCSSPYVFVREYRFGARREPRGAESRRLPYRADLSIKCADCSAVWAHGLALDAAAATRIGVPDRAVRVIHWRDAVPMIRAWKHAQDSGPPGR